MSYRLIQRLALKFAIKREIPTDPLEMDEMESPNLDEFEEKYDPKIKEKNYGEYFDTEYEPDNRLDDYDPALLLSKINKFLKVQ